MERWESRDGKTHGGNTGRERRDGNPGLWGGGAAPAPCGRRREEGNPHKGTEPPSAARPGPAWGHGPAFPPPRTQRRLARGRARAERAAACPPRGRCGAADHGGSGTADPFLLPPKLRRWGVPRKSHSNAASPQAAPRIPDPKRRGRREDAPGGVPRDAGGPGGVRAPRPPPPAVLTPPPHVLPPHVAAPGPAPHASPRLPAPIGRPPPRRSARAERGVLASACDVTGRGGRR